MGIGYLPYIITSVGKKIQAAKQMLRFHAVHAAAIIKFMKKYDLSSYQKACAAYKNVGVFYRLTGKMPESGQSIDSMYPSYLRLMQDLNLETPLEAIELITSPARLLERFDHQIPPPGILSAEQQKILKIMVTYHLASYELAESVYQDPIKLITMTQQIPQIEDFPGQADKIYANTDCMFYRYRMPGCKVEEPTCYACPLYQKAKGNP